MFHCERFKINPSSDHLGHRLILTFQSFAFCFNGGDLKLPAKGHFAYTHGLHVSPIRGAGGPGGLQDPSQPRSSETLVFLGLFTELIKLNGLGHP